MTDYLNNTNEQEDIFIAREPVVSMTLRQTTDLFEKHYDPNASIENGLELHEGFDLLRSRIETKRYEKNRVIS